MSNWYPTASVIQGNNGGDFLPEYPKRIVLHTTEGSSASGAIGAYRSANSWPHFTVDRNSSFTVYQHNPIDLASRALRNAAGGVETNRGGAIQIEVVGFASEAGIWPSGQRAALKNLMRWIEAEHGVKQYGPAFGGSEQFGLNNPLQFTPEYWKSFNGTCGHQHVPENDHWDPGALNVSTLFTPAEGFQLPEIYFTETIGGSFVLHHKDTGYIVVGTDGGIFAYGAPFFGSVPGLGIQARIIAGAWTLTGLGYWLLGSDGGIFSFGDAPYHGAFNVLSKATRGTRKPIGIVSKGNGYRIIVLDPTRDGSPFDGYEFGVL